MDIINMFIIKNKIKHLTYDFYNFDYIEFKREHKQDFLNFYIEKKQFHLIYINYIQLFVFLKKGEDKINYFIYLNHLTFESILLKKLLLLLLRYLR